METIKFKTNINCSGCLAKVTPFLNEEKSIETWEVDILSPEKILTVKSPDANRETVIKAVQKAGFKIEEIKP
ncbi:MAG: heavy-metal-associated domain-containing protein [Bacteroidetes bacterium]|nr:heavy-metal-associated domain-containing protein [Bacteroidota bacterium]